MDKLYKKIYYRIDFHNASSMSIGSGEAEETDGDIVRDSAGLPYIPGSALAGMYRAMFEGLEIQKQYFGEIKKAEKSDDEGSQSESRIVVYDARPAADSRIYISSWDCVALDQEKVAVDDSKFDFQIVEPGTRFTCYIEQNLYEGDLEIGDFLAQAFEQRRFFAGAKVTRGYGALEADAIYKKSYLFKDDGPDCTEKTSGTIADWLEFDMYCPECWKDSDKWQWDSRETDRELLECWKLLDVKRDTLVEAELSLKSGIDIRRYMTQDTKNNENTPDYVQLFVRENKDQKEKHRSVIPGTSWAGAFLSDMRKLAEQNGYVEMGELQRAFGNLAGKDKRKSQILFAESFLNDEAKEKQVTRNAVDRFSGGTGNGALYTERMCHGGSTTLQITVDNNTDEKIKRLLAGALMDLHMGFLSVGGLTAVGRGLFEISALSINGRMLDEISFSAIVNALGGEQ